MKITRSFIIVLLSMLVISCVEEVPVDNDRFIKVFGKESGSFGSAIHEFPNGNLLLGAKIDVPAFDFTNVAGVYAIGKVVEGSIALIKADKNGMQTNLSLMPIASHETVPSLEFTDLSGRAIISQVLPTSDGGFMVLGQWRGMGVSVYMPNDTLNLDESANITSPFLMKVNQEMAIEFIRSANGEVGWDGTYHSQARMKLLPNGNIGVLAGKNVYDYDHGIFQGYSFSEITQTGDTIMFSDYYNPGNNIKLTYDFVMNDNGDLCLIGQVNDNLFMIIHLAANPGQQRWEYIEPSGMRGGVPNNNPMFIEQFSDNSFVMVYTDPPANTRIAFATNDYNISNPRAISVLPDEYPRAVYVTANDDILIYTEHLTKTTIPEGYLYRIHRNGQTKFRIRIEGTPGDVIESADGTILVLANPLFNGLIPKTRLTKLSPDGKTF